MRHFNGAGLATVAVVAVFVLSAPGCWQQRVAQQRAMAAALAEEKAAVDTMLVAVDAARVKGTADATQDIARGNLKQKEYPPFPSPPWHQNYVTLLSERCNVEWEVVQGPAGISDTLREEVNAYNTVMITEIERRFGVGILEKLQHEAEGK